MANRQKAVPESLCALKTTQHPSPETGACFDQGSMLAAARANLRAQHGEPVTVRTQSGALLRANEPAMAAMRAAVLGAKHRERAMRKLREARAIARRQK